MSIAGTKIKSASICLISRRFPPQYSGAGQQALTLARQLIKQVPLFVVCEHTNKRNQVDHIDGVPIYRLKSSNKSYPFGLEKIFFAIRLLFFLISKRHEFTIIHCIGSSFILIPVMIIAKLFNKKVCVKLTLAGLQGDSPDALRKKKFGKIKYLALLKADAVICVSRQLYSICTENGIAHDKLFLIPNGVDTEYFKPLDKNKKHWIRKQLELPIDANIICFTGIADRRKRIDIAISSVAKALKEISDLYFLIIGPRDEKDKDFTDSLDNIIREAGISDKIRFTGYQPFEKAGQYMQASDIFLFPSQKEGLPNALLEAMACGLCCIVADAPPMNQLIDNQKDGFLIKPVGVNNDSPQIIQLYMKQKELIKTIQTNARQKIVKVYDISGIAMQYVSVYEKITFSITCKDSH